MCSIGGLKPYDESQIGEPHNAGRIDTPCRHCGALYCITERLTNSSAANPKFGRQCCSEGRVKLEQLPSPPEPLLRHFTSDAEFWFV